MSLRESESKSQPRDRPTNGNMLASMSLRESKSQPRDDSWPTNSQELTRTQVVKFNIKNQSPFSLNELRILHYDTASPIPPKQDRTAMVDYDQSVAEIRLFPHETFPLLFYFETVDGRIICQDNRRLSVFLNYEDPRVCLATLEIPPNVYARATTTSLDTTTNKENQTSQDTDTSNSRQGTVKSGTTIASTSDQKAAASSPSGRPTTILQQSSKQQDATKPAATTTLQQSTSQSSVAGPNTNSTSSNGASANGSNPTAEIEGDDDDDEAAERKNSTTKSGTLASVSTNRGTTTTGTTATTTTTAVVSAPTATTSTRGVAPTASRDTGATGATSATQPSATQPGTAAVPPTATTAFTLEDDGFTLEDDDADDNDEDANDTGSNANADTVDNGDDENNGDAASNATGGAAATSTSSDAERLRLLLEERARREAFLDSRAGRRAELLKDLPLDDQGRHKMTKAEHGTLLRRLEKNRDIITGQSKEAKETRRELKGYGLDYSRFHNQTDLEILGTAGLVVQVLVQQEESWQVKYLDLENAVFVGDEARCPLKQRPVSDKFVPGVLFIKESLRTLEKVQGQGVWLNVASLAHSKVAATMATFTHRRLTTEKDLVLTGELEIDEVTNHHVLFDMCVGEFGGKDKHAETFVEEAPQEFPDDFLETLDEAKRAIRGGHAAPTQEDHDESQSESYDLHPSGKELVDVETEPNSKYVCEKKCAVIVWHFLVTEVVQIKEDSQEYKKRLKELNEFFTDLENNHKHASPETAAHMISKRIQDLLEEPPSNDGAHKKPKKWTHYAIQAVEEKDPVKRVDPDESATIVFQIGDHCLHIWAKLLGNWLIETSERRVLLLNEGNLNQMMGHYIPSKIKLQHRIMSEKSLGPLKHRLAPLVRKLEAARAADLAVASSAASEQEAKTGLCPKCNKVKPFSNKQHKLLEKMNANQSTGGKLPRCKDCVEN